MPSPPESMRLVRLAFGVVMLGLIVWWETSSLGRHDVQKKNDMRHPWHDASELRPLNITPATTRFTPPFRTQGRQIVDASGTTIKLVSVNYYGASDIHFVPTGLDVRHRDDIALLIRQIGFNSVRLLYSDELVRDNPVIEAAYVSANPDLFAAGTPPRALDVFWAVVESLTAAGILVIVNNHITQATWCCGTNPCDAAWSNDWFFGGWPCRVRQTEADWIDHWETIMRPLAGNPLVLGADLRNEVRGLMTWGTWAAAAEHAGERLLTLNPDWLIVVGGISAANDLSGVGYRPVQLSRTGRVVYSSHVYKWSGWPLKRLEGLTYEQFAAVMQKNWAYLLRENQAPVWVGEMGVTPRPTVGGRNYWDHLMLFLREIDASWGLWTLNPRKPWSDPKGKVPKEGREGYGLVNDTWDGLRCDFRYSDLQVLGLRSSRQMCTK